MPVVRAEWELEPKQLQFITSDADELMYSGGFGGGKTLMVCLRAAMRARDPRAVEVLARASLDDVRETILPTLFDGAGDTPPVLPAGTYTWYKADRVIRIHGGGLIKYRGLGATMQERLDKMKFRGQNVTGVGIDQAEEISLKQYSNALGRVRSAGVGLTRSVYGSCNPSAPTHWIAQRFGITSGHDPETTPFIASELRHKGALVKLLAILTSPFENPHLPADYMARLAQYVGVMYLRYVRGRWVGSEGVVYDNWDRAVHELSRKGPWARTLIGIDDGTSKPAAILLARVDGDGRIHIEREIHRSGMLVKEKLEHVRRFGKVEAVVVDPAAAQIKAELRAAGFTVHDGVNDVIPGIQEVRSRLEKRPDGRPGITIAPECVELIKEIESYEWDEGAKQEKPVKVNDHAVDALRYLVMHMDRPPPMAFDVDQLLTIEQGMRTKPVQIFLTHQHGAGREQDQSIARRLATEVGYVQDPNGPIRLWSPLVKRRPSKDTTFALFIAASGGAGSGPSYITVADVSTQSIAAEYCALVPPDRLARIAAMMSIWFIGGASEPAPIGVYLNAPGRIVLGHLTTLNASVTLEWEPDAREFAEQVGVLRAVWESRTFIEHEPLAFTTAREYVYHNQTLMHVSLLNDTERRGTWADRVIARAGLWQLLTGTQPPEAPEPEYSPTSLKGMQKARADKEPRNSAWR